MAWIRPFRHVIGVTSPFGNRISPITGKPEFHNGVDAGNAFGDEIFMMFDGYLDIYIDEVDTIYLVMIENGTNDRVDILHVDKVINPRRKVKQGELVGYTGKSGKYVTGPHTHTQLRRDWEKNRNNYIDPTFILSLPFRNTTMQKWTIIGKDTINHDDWRVIVQEVQKQKNKGATNIKVVNNHTGQEFSNETIFASNWYEEAVNIWPNKYDSDIKATKKEIKAINDLLFIAVDEREKALNRAVIAEEQLKNKDEGINLLKLRIKALEAEAEKNTLEKIINYIFNLFNKKDNASSKRSSEGTTESDTNSSNTSGN